MQKEATMKACDTCGNVYDKSFELILNGQRHTFDSFECAISKCAPRCAHCGCSIIGHGAEAGSQIYCCAHCARHQGESEIRDRAV
jgi:hypothetical protein